MINTILLETGCFAAATAVSGCVIYFVLRAKFLGRTAANTASSDMVQRLEALAREIENCRSQLAEGERRYAPMSENFPGPASLHLNRRGQIAQLYRHGETPRNIASALGISQGEVKLIIRLSGIARSADSIDNSQTFGRKSIQTFDNASVAEEE